MVEWTDEAIMAAEEAYIGLKPRYVSDEMRAALNAAVKAQGLDAKTLPLLIGYEQGRAEGFEEAISFGEELARDAFYADSDSVLEQMRNKFLVGA